MDVSIIIVSYNTSNLLANCLESIIKQTKDIEYEIIVVDNNSSDGTQDMLKLSYPSVKLIESKVNLGFGKANNLGMSKSKGKYLFLLNSDTILLNNAVKIFYNYSESHPNLGAIGCILLGKDQKPCHSYGNFITPLNEVKDGISRYFPFLKDKAITKPNLVREPKEVDYITGADLWIPKNVYDMIGGFDPDFFMYCEEVDWQKRMEENNYNRIIIPGPQIIHLEGGSDSSKSSVWSFTRLKNIYISKKIYQNKHFKGWCFPIFRVVYKFITIPSLLILGITKNSEYIKLIKYL